MKNASKKKIIGCSYLIFIFIVIIIIITMPGNKKKEADTRENTTESEIITTEDMSIDKILCEYVGESLSEKIINVYQSDLGFSEITFKEKIEQTNNYYIIANNYKTMLTIINDDIRIFIPDTSYVFYENGKVVMTFSDLQDRTITEDDMPYYYSIAQMIIEDNIKHPDSVKYPSSSKIEYQKNKDIVAIRGYFTAKNDFGQKIKTNYVVEFKVNDLKNLEFEKIYVEIGNDKSGKFIQVE